MSKVSRQKEKYSNDTELSRDKANEGTSARTRAFSFGQIMERRKKKVVGYEEPEKILKRDKVEDVVDHAEANGDYRQSKGSVIGSKKHVSEDITKKTYRKKEENRDLEYNKKRDSGNKDKESRDSEYTKKRDSEKKDKESHDSEYTRKKDSEKKDKENRVSEAKLTEKFDIDMHSKAKGDRKDKRLFRSSNREYSRDVVEDESKKKHLEKSEKHRDKEREKNEREVKRKHISNDDGKSRPDIDDVNVAKKHNSGKRYDLTPAEGTGRKKETLQSHHGEARPKRRRSRSRESRDARDRDRHTHHGREHGDSLKDRRSDVDKNRTSNNGGYTNVQNRHPGGQRSGLGGYSPRKRRSDAAIKTPSPTARSPERIGAGWDLPPTGADTSGMSRHTVSSKASISLSESSPKTSSMSKNISINSAQLTHASLPSRTLYVENLPAAASDKFVMECLNSFLMSSGVSFNQGSQPCISCNINKAKGEALVEFLSQEVARAALSFDGRSIYGSIIRIRHPKDFVEATNGVQEKSMAAVDKISDIVENSPHKIFIGGISEALSSNMLMEIASAFGILRAYRFQFYKEINGSCAFLEYIDHSITYIACAGLNGMKLGGKVLTVLQAFPDESPQENAEKAPFYGIPEYAKPLLSEPTNVLKLENALNQEKLSSLSESELEEILEDIRLECSRFGTVKSVNIVRYESGVIVPETCEISCQTDMRSSLHDPESTVCTERIKTAEEADNETQENSRQEVIEGIKFSLEECGNAEDCRGSIVDKPDDDLSKNEMSETPQLGSIEVEVEQLDPKMDAKESSTQIDANKSKSNNGSNDIESSSIVEEPKQDDATVELQEKPRSVRRESDASSNDESKEKISSFDNIFEQGCIFVEYVRAEASCAAAHCLHRRLYGERVVVVDYVPHDLYLSKFPK